MSIYSLKNEKYAKRWEDKAVKKSVIVLMLALAALGLLAGCDGEVAANPEGINDAVVEQVGEFAEVTDLEAAFGHNIANFGDNNIEGYAASEFNLISDEYPMAEVIYTKGENSMAVRTAHTEKGDISGVESSGSFLDYQSNDVAVKYATVLDDTYMAYWVYDGYSYSVYETEEMEETFFKVLVDYLTADIAEKSE